MAHKFFENIDWNALKACKPTGSYTPSKPRYTIDDYKDAFQESEFDEKTIYAIYNTDDEPAENQALFGNVKDWEFNRNHKE